MSHDRDEGINLAGQVAIVTGGGRGIGKAIAMALARADASVAVVARSGDQLAETAKEITEAGGRAISVTADVSDPGAVERMVVEVEKSLGSVDLLVNNAGLPGPIGPTWETDPDDWWRCLEVNLRGPMLCSRAVLPGMIAREGGRIVNVASGAGTFAIPYLGAYVTSKTALIRFTEILALEAERTASRSLPSSRGLSARRWLSMLWNRKKDSGGCPGSVRYSSEVKTCRPFMLPTSWSCWRQGVPTLSPVGSSRSRMMLSDSLSGLVVRVLVTCRLFG